MKRMRRKEYIDRVDRLERLLKEEESHSINELAEEFGVHARTIYRMISEIEKRGFVVDLSRGAPHIIGLDQLPSDSQVGFSAEERKSIIALTNMLSVDNPYCVGLEGNRWGMLKEILMPYLSCEESSLLYASRINSAIKRQRQIQILRYQSGNSGTIADRLVEPTQWSPNYRQVYGYDVEKKGMRTFVLGRMGGVKILDQTWAHREAHRVIETDCFWMTGEPYSITLRMNLRALNLLHEEYPLSRNVTVREVEDKRRPYEVTLIVRSPLGVGRFVKGLSSDVKIVSTEKKGVKE